MNTRNYGQYAIAVAIALVGVLALGMPLATLIWLALVAACPLMMFFMMRGMHGQDMHGGHDCETRDEEPLHKHDRHAGPGQGVSAMAAVIASPAGVLILTGIVYDTARLVTLDEPRCPSLARLRGRRAALRAAENRCVGLRLHHRMGGRHG